VIAYALRIQLRSARECPGKVAPTSAKATFTTSRSKAARNGAPHRMRTRDAVPGPAI
jgi:hypothetical protein